MESSKTQYTKDLPNKKIFVTRHFDAPLENVWRAWTESELLDQWWAPLPWKTETKSMNFTTGGTWLYSMVGPEGERHWCKADYIAVLPQKSFEGLDCFCDENGNKNPDMPGMHWKCSFTAVGNTTRVDVELAFPTEAELEKIIEMGFKEGFAAAHGNLDTLLLNIK